MAMASATALPACGGGGAPSASVSRTLTVPTGAARGCGTTTPTSAPTTSRSTAPAAPSSCTSPLGDANTSAVALVLNLHGSGATAIDQDAFSGMDATADANDFLVAYPQGVIPEGAGDDWNVPGEPLVGGGAVPAGTPSDVTFLATLVRALEARFCVRADEVYATGFSGGARMASQLACDESTVFAAVAAVSGLRRPTPCPTTRPVPILGFHGTADPVDPITGDGEAYWTYSVSAAAADWASEDRCSSTPKTSHPDPDVTLTAYGRCAGGAAVELYTVTGEGHEWPGGPAMPAALVGVLGPQSSAIDADSVIWSFFAAHPLHVSSR